MDEFDNVSRDNKSLENTNKTPKEFFVDRDNFSGSEFNADVNKKKIKKAIAVVSSIISISLIAGGGISIGNQSFEHANATVSYTVLNIESRQITYEIEVISSLDLTLTLSNNFTNRIHQLKPGTNVGSFENIKPDTSYNLYINAGDLFGTKIDNKDIKTPLASANDIFYFDNPSFRLDGKYSFELYFNNQIYNKDDLECTFIPKYGDPFIIKPPNSQEKCNIDLADYSIFSSDGVMKLRNKINDEILIEKNINFSNKITDFIGVSLINKNETYIIDFDFKDQNNVWKEFYVELSNDKIVDSRLLNKKRAMNEGIIISKQDFNSTLLDLKIHAIPILDEEEKILVFDKQINLTEEI